MLLVVSNVEPETGAEVFERMLSGKWVTQADQSKQLRSALDELYMDDEQLAETLRRAFQPDPVQLKLFDLEPVAVPPRRRLQLVPE